MIEMRMKREFQRNSWHNIVKHRAYFVLLLPLLLYFLIFRYVPMYGVVIAFQDYKLSKGILGSTWVGLDNFRELFGTYKFHTVMRNTLLISLYKLLIGFPAPIIFTLLLNEIRINAYKRVVQTISYLPHFISWVVLSGIFYDILSPTTGALNCVLQFFGMKSIYFMAEPALFRGVLVVTSIWAEIGWSSIIYLSAIASVDVEQYEAAELEGANRYQCMRYITFPSILPVVSITFILAMGNLLDAGFDQVYNMMNDLLISTGDILDTYVYRMGLKDLRYSFSAAVGLFKNVIGLMGVLITNLVVRRLSDDGNALW